MAKFHLQQVLTCFACITLLLLLVPYANQPGGVVAQEETSVPIAANDRQQENALNPTSYRDLVIADQPVFYLDFQNENDALDSTNDPWTARNLAIEPFEVSDENGNETAERLQHNYSGQVVGSPTIWQLAPRRPTFSNLSHDNLALFLNGQSYLRYSDPGDESPLDFDVGDEITLEAWVHPLRIGNDQQIYVVGKGRTNRPNVAADNQNFALRLRGQGGQACISFLYRASENRSGVREDFHRWTSTRGFAIDEQWHHIAVTYRFGDEDSIVGYIDGQPVNGTWDIGGASSRAPVVDNDELWVGSSIGGNASCSFYGGLDEVAIYRSALTAADIEKRYQSTSRRSTITALVPAQLPSDKVMVEIVEGVNSEDIWASEEVYLSSRFENSHFALVDVPQAYLPGGIRSDRPTPYLARIQANVTLPAGKHRLLLRAKSATRLVVDAETLGELPFMVRNSSGHESVPDLIEPLFDAMHPLPAGHREELIDFEVTESGEVHVLVETAIGGSNVRDELGEFCLAIELEGESVFRVLTPDGPDQGAFTESYWQRLRGRLVSTIDEVDRLAREASDADQRDYWAARHAYAAEVVSRQSPIVSTEASQTSIDGYLNDALRDEGIIATERVDDYQFLRRLSLDTVGVIPTLAEWDRYFADPPTQRRSLAIDRLLDDPRWADHWVSYWQDVLAENPGILKPEQNNTGPFRYWIYESLLDNKPADRFATELIAMRGSVYGGGPAGFRLATQNDVPMAAKALVIGQAFLGMQMKCARCHDSPIREATQHELFSMAAMLNQSSISLPASSSVPLSDDARAPAVTVSIEPGTQIEPAWPFSPTFFVSRHADAQASSSDVIDDLRERVTDTGTQWIRRPGDTREELAWLITSPHNQRFPKVMANRVWQRLMGRGIVDPVDDWQSAKPTHPELLEFLSRELVIHAYDLKHIARLVLNSDAYQRRADPTDEYASRWFYSQPTKRLSAEQIVDSLYVSVGKSYDCEQITFDPEGRRPSSTFLNLGQPRRAWEFSSLANERDRPALALPRAQAVIDLLIAFGWREARPNGLTDREQDVQLLQPLTLANGNAMHRLSQLSENGDVVALCIDCESVEQFVDRLTLKILGRPPTETDRSLLTEFLSPGFETRITNLELEPFVPYALYRTNVSWSNHLSPEASEIMLELERAARMGDPPTHRIEREWRERVEDVLWAMMNSPEFQFRP